MPEISSGMPVNDATGKEVRTRSRFPLSYKLFNTTRFGELVPHFVMETVPGDKVTLRSSHSVRSYTLGAPLMQNIELKKDYFFVPMEAIMPKNWDKFFTNPTIGDDVPDLVAPVFSFSYYLSRDFNAATAGTFLNSLKSIQAGQLSTITDVQRLRWWLFSLVHFEKFFSRGSLLSSLGFSVSNFFHYTLSDESTIGFDEFFDLAMAGLQKELQFLEVNFPELDVDFSPIAGTGKTYFVIIDTTGISVESLANIHECISLREFLEKIRSNSVFDVVSFSPLASYATPYVPSLDGTPVDYLSFSFVNPNSLVLNMSRLVAYQLCCAHFYTNDKVDYIYSAQLFLQYLTTCAAHYAGSYTPQVFNYNGVRYEYDAISKANVNNVFNTLSTKLNLSDSAYFMSGRYNACAIYVDALFSYNHSLRFVDYFVGSRTRPLAVGNVDVSVQNNAVSVIDVSRNIQFQRFLNSVNRTGRVISEYVKGLFNVQQAPDFHNPFYLSHTNDTIFAAEVENTGAEQYQRELSITSSLKSNASRYAFEFECDRNGILIGISYYDIARAYCNFVERQLMHQDRFDMFNPYLQFIGDQPVYQHEIGSRVSLSSPSLNPFGYQLRYMEYKQRFNQAIGGFANKALPYLSFIADRRDYPVNGEQHIDPDFIRSRSSELDDFYLSLSGWSLGTYFHFIVVNDNDCEASRPMAFAPSIL